MTELQIPTTHFSPFRPTELQQRQHQQEEETNIDLGLLHLDTSSSPTAPCHHLHRSRRTCTCSSDPAVTVTNKRRSPDQDQLFLLKKPRKLFPDAQETNASAVYTSPNAASTVHTSPNAAVSSVATGSPLLPPRWPGLRRTVSDPSPVDECPSQLLKRMRDCMKEMNQFWERILPPGKCLQEEQREDEVEEETAKVSVEDNSTNPVMIKSDSVLAKSEEAVSVEKSGEGLNINFKCPCGKGYQFFFSGGSCYYKLV